MVASSRRSANRLNFKRVCGVPAVVAIHAVCFPSRTARCVRAPDLQRICRGTIASPTALDIQRKRAQTPFSKRTPGDEHAEEAHGGLPCRNRLRRCTGIAQTSTTPSGPTDRPTATGSGSATTGSSAMQPGAGAGSGKVRPCRRDHRHARALRPAAHRRWAQHPAPDRRPWPRAEPERHAGSIHDPDAAASR